MGKTFEELWATRTRVCSRLEELRGKDAHHDDQARQAAWSAMQAIRGSRWHGRDPAFRAQSKLDPALVFRLLRSE